MNPSPPFLGFVSAACGPAVLEEQTEFQLQNFRPPHPEGSMVSEEILRVGIPQKPVVNGNDNGHADVESQ